VERRFPIEVKAPQEIFDDLLWRRPRHLRLAVWSSLFAGAALSLLFVQAEGPWVGLMQRSLITAVSGWLILVALRVRTIASARETVPGENVSANA
jgi:hypothetical protein